MRFIILIARRAQSLGEMRLGAGTGAKQVRKAPVGCYQSTENSSILEKEKFRIPKGKHLTD
ncbi:MAG: hypothetical protein CMN67_04135 [Sphingomonadaceae bacterium]|nr:hypothetical protein [Sphingomonadaceae bacterium]